MPVSFSRFHLTVGFISLVGLLLQPVAASSQVTEDLSQGTRVESNDGGVYTIYDGTTHGSNLFHSFDQFSLSAGEEALIYHEEGVDTIINRVTGDSVSEIDGLISTPDYSFADVFLINPNGIVFGPNASLYVGGSFIASTAESVIFPGGVEFNASNAAPVTLTIDRPIGLLLGRNAGELIHRATDLYVLENETIALIGNGILQEGGIYSQSSRIDLLSVSPETLVPVSFQNGEDEPTWVLDYEYLNAREFRDIELNNGSFLDVSNDDSSQAPSGDIFLRGRRITVAGSEIFSEGDNLSTGGEIDIAVSERLVISNGSLINASTRGRSDAGAVLVGGSGSVELRGSSRVLTQSDTLAAGASGIVELRVGNLFIREGSEISIGSPGRFGAPGRLLVDTPNGSVKIIGISGGDHSRIIADTNGQPSAGDIQINTGTLLLQDGGEILSNTRGSGDAGRVAINATDSVSIIGMRDFPSKISSASNESARGNAGDILITTGRLLVQDEASIFTSTNTSGQGGELTVRADEVFLSGEGSKPTGLFARTEGSGDSGTLSLTADRLIIEDGARISIGTDEELREEIGADANMSQQVLLQTLGTVREANITARMIVLDNGQIIADSLSGDGGELNLNVQDSIVLRNNSLVSTSAGTADLGGTGGSIDVVSPNGFILAIPGENSDIIANAFEGPGGNINIAARSILGIESRPSVVGNLTNDISASSEFGPSGVVAINNLEPDPAQDTAELPANTADPYPVAQRCLADSQGQSAFVVTGQGGAPPSPSDIIRNESIGLSELSRLSSESTSLVATAPVSNTVSTANAEIPLIEAEGWRRDASGNIVLLARDISVQAMSSNYHSCIHQSRG